MKLIFLGDSFTEGAGIDIEYAIQKKYIEDNDLFYIDSNKIKEKDFNLLSEYQLEDIKKFKNENSWVSLISKKLGLEYENIAIPGSGLQEVYTQFLNYEYFHFNENIFYLFFLPVTDPTRILISNKGSKLNIESDIRFLFQTYLYSKKEEDINVFKKKFDVYYFYIIKINILMNLIYYLKNNNKKFLILPTWKLNIYNHFLDSLNMSNFLKKNNIIKLFLNIKDKQKEEEQERIKIFKHFFENFVFNEIKDQMDFNFDISKYKKMPCHHPNIESQEKISDAYFDYIKTYIDKL